MSLTPVDEQGATLAGEGVLDGVSVFYGNSEDANAGVVDVDTLVKPSTFGFMMETSLRSQRSPSKLFFKVSLPEEATLEQESPGSGPVRVVKGGKRLAVIFAPSARDAEGTSVPVSMIVEGDMLVLTVDHPAGAYAYPITVDPRTEYEYTEFTWDNEINASGSHPTNWHFEHEGGYFTGSENSGGNGWTIHIASNHGEHEWGAMVYTTKGLSHIWDFASESAESDEGAHVEPRVQTYAKGGVEYEYKPPLNYDGWNDAVGCRMKSEECSKITPEDNNSAAYLALANGAATGVAAENVFHKAEVAIQQEVNPEVKFDTTDETVDGHPNALYGIKTWLGPHTNALVKFTAADKGIGVEGWRTESSNANGTEWKSLSEASMLTEGLCSGIQCPSEVSEYIGYTSALQDGEPSLGLDAWNAMYDSHAKENEGESLRRHAVKVDSTPPHSIAISGLLAGNEIGAGEYHLEAEATDGSGTTPSSGVKSLALQIDGKEVGVPSGSCETPTGPCTAHAEWTIAGRNYAVGKHTVAVIATDNAGNVAVEDFVVTVRAASSVALSPGSLNLESGEFTLGATDVSMGTGLTVSRSYGSRHLSAGSDGPLGAQWALSLTGQEQLEVEPNESVVFTESKGSQDIFRSKSKGVFEVPPGDSNLGLSEGEVEGKKAYILANSASDTKTVFTLPSGGSTVWVPTKQEGPVTTDTATYKYQTVEGQSEYGLPSGSEPAGIAAGPDGNLWFADYSTSKIGKITTSGALTEYALPSSSGPFGIVAGSDKNMWFTNEISSKIGKVTASGVVTEYSLPAGSDPYELAEGPDGNVWFVDFGTSKIGKITTSGVITEYALPASSDPYGITAGPDGNLWFTDWDSNKIGKITTSGSITEYSLSSGSYPLRITTGPDGNLWFTDKGTSKIGKITTSGSITEFSMPSGSEPYGIVTGPDGNLWFTEITASKVGKIPISGTTTEPTEALAPVPAGVSCSWKEKPTEMKPGCRALEFKYASETTARGEVETEWGAYDRRLAKVLAVAYNPSAKVMEEKTVAEYFYDKLGRLRAEWDPRVSPALRTVYGYDAEGHVTALTEPGQESWAFAYGTVAGDPNTGRLLKVTRAPASAKLWKGEAPKNTEAPKLSGVAVTGVTMSVSIGAWSNEPVAYTYKWDDCNAEGTDCTSIPGATNADYTLTGSDTGQTVIAQVTAMNGGGSVGASTAASGSVRPEITEYGLPSGSEPAGIAAGPDGNLWFADYSTSKIGKITTSGALTEYALPSSSGPFGIVAGSDKNMWFTNEISSKIGKVTASGVVTEYSLPAGSDPYELAEGPDGNVWFVDFGTSKIGKITTSGVITEYALPASSDPYGITAGPDGNLWFTDWDSNKIGKITTSGSITEYSLSSGSYPLRITTGPDDNLWFTEKGTNKIGRITTSGAVTEYALPSGSEPFTIATGPDGNLWFTDKGTSKIGKITTSGSITEFSMPSGSEPYGIVTGPDGNLWFTEITASKVGKVLLSPAEGEHGTPQPGSTIEYNVPLSGTGLPTMTKEAVGKWGQTDDPAEATAIFPPDEGQSWPATSYKRATNYYLDSKGRTVNVSSPTGGISTSEYNESNDVVRTLSPDDRVAAQAEGSKSAEVAKLLSTESKYNGESKEEKEKEEKEGNSAPGTMLLETLGPQHAVRLVHGKTKENEEVQARNHTVYSYDAGAPAEGGPYRLVTQVTQGAQVNGEADRDVRTVTDSYSGQEGLGWKLREPTSVTASPSGLKLTHTTVYEASTGNVIEKREPGSTGEGNTHDTKTIYYSAAENTSYPSCGKVPQWANLPCETLPGKQPEPALPVTTTTYNMWDKPETVVRTVGSATRTTANVYDAAGRLTSTHATSTTGTALPTVSNKYSEATGQLVEQSTTTGTETKTITSKYNTLGQLVKYTDANGNSTEYEYEPEKDRRLTHVNDGKGSQTYTYEETTGDLTKLVDTQGTNVLTFTATYDTEGNIASEGYPNAMTARYTRNQAGEETGIEYTKEKDCASKCPETWISDTIVPSIHDQTLEQVTSFAKDSYTYDEAGRLTQAQETPTGEGCTTRLYEYEEESNRKKLTTRAPGTGGVCASEGGTTQTHTYDSANRLTDTGTTYDTFGDITKLPATDAGGTELQSTFYVDGQLDEQKQGGQTIGYQLDPDGRILDTVDTGTVNSTYETHYSGPGDAPSWTVEPTSGHWKRYVSGIAGLAAIETDTTEPELQLTDLDSDVVARASVSETATKLLSTERSTEYGVPTTTKPAKYSWLGGDLLPTELPSGVVAMGARNYVPQIGRFLQPDPLPGGSNNAYAYTDGNPVNETDLTGDYVENDYSAGIFDAENIQAIELEAAREAAARAEAERKAQIAAAIAAMDASIAAEEAVKNAQDLWYAEAKEFGEDNIAGGGMVEEGGGSGGGRFAGNEDPGVPPGAQCEGSTDSKKYKKEHPKLCHEIESNPWEPLEAWCYLFPNPFCNVAEKVKQAKH